MVGVGFLEKLGNQVTAVAGGGAALIVTASSLNGAPALRFDSHARSETSLRPNPHVYACRSSHLLSERTRQRIATPPPALSGCQLSGIAAFDAALLSTQGTHSITSALLPLRLCALSATSCQGKDSRRGLAQHQRPQAWA